MKPLKRTRIKAKRMTPVKRTKSKHKLLEDECDRLWSYLVKLKAGFKSELSGKTGGLDSHHLLGKPNYRLRYEVSNGMCLTSGEHFFTAHNAGRYEDFRRRVMELRGKDIFDKLYQLKWDQCKTDLGLVKVYLEQEIKKY